MISGLLLSAIVAIGGNHQGRIGRAGTINNLASLSVSGATTVDGTFTVEAGSADFSVNGSSGLVTAGGQLVVTAGSNADPGIRGTTSNTGLQLSSDIRLGVGGTVRLQAHSTGVTVVGAQFNIDGVDSDLTSSCTSGDLRVDTGVTPELCWCFATNTWYCVNFTDLTGPND